MKNCLQCSKPITDNKKFCSPICKRKWWNSTYYRSHRDEMRLSFKDRYNKLKQENLIRTIQLVTTKVPKTDALMMLTLPNDTLTKSNANTKHLRMHGENFITLERYTYSVGRCRVCGTREFVNLPVKLMSPEDSLLLAVQRKYKGKPYRMWKLIEKLEKMNRNYEADILTWLYSEMFTDTNLQ